MIIDSHQHFWRLDRGDYEWLTPRLGILYGDFEPDDLAPSLAHAQVDATVLVQAAASEEETRYLFELARRNRFIAGVVGWVDFEAADSPRRIDALVADGGGLLKGLRPMVQDIEDMEWLTRPSLNRTFGAMVEQGLTFDALVRPEHLTILQKRLVQHPYLRAVLDHAAKPPIKDRRFEPWASDLAELAAHTSVSCKLSGLITEAGGDCAAEELDPYAAHVFDCFGPKRVMWGSDWPILNLYAGYEDWYSMARDLVGRHAPGFENLVFGGNAMKFYGLHFGSFESANLGKGNA